MFLRSRFRDDRLKMVMLPLKSYFQAALLTPVLLPVKFNEDSSTGK